ncbi:hypothetical protein [Fimbriiglobus ruber]|uniref:hypothetical protein n=1 Tax=Fimbriiglobus ruber TaxID=1908690 RepID=UPI000B4C00F0|nr:hypothetical protein [Fimbriiglobus ruber]
MRRVLIGMVCITLIAIVATAYARPSATEPPAGSYRLLVQEIITRHDALVTQVAIEARAGKRVRIFPDGKEREGLSVVMPEMSGKAVSRIQLTIFADRVEISAAKVNGVKFFLALDGSSMTQTEAIPESSKTLGMNVLLKPGIYPEGAPTGAVVFMGLMHKLVVE